MADDIEQLLAYGRIGLETGYYEQARGYFEQVLALDPSNLEATKGLARANAMLSSREAVKPVRQRKPAKPPPMAEPQRTVPEKRAQEWWGPPAQEVRERPRLDDREDSMEFETNDDLEWLSLQLKHVPIKTWMIVFVKMGVAYMVLMAVLAIIAFAASLILAQIDISIMEVLRDFL
jgi:tetratricopeptide (TPR) repeat protein